MTREIKFRAWTKAEESSDSGKTYTDCSFMESWEEMKQEGLEYYFDGKSNLMQYTGLKDKNGKEIYEGDILQRWVEETETTTGEQRMMVDDMCNCYATIRDCYIDGGPLEIIGNIYEHGHLLDDTQPLETRADNNDLTNA